jgi:hypothetical protein
MFSKEKVRISGYSVAGDKSWPGKEVFLEFIEHFKSKEDCLKFLDLTSWTTVANYASGGTRLPIELCLRIQHLTDGKYKLEDLCPRLKPYLKHYKFEIKGE